MLCHYKIELRELVKTTNYECEVYKHITSRYITEIYLQDSEQQAVFDACQYILDKKEK